VIITDKITSKNAISNACKKVEEWLTPLSTLENTDMAWTPYLALNSWGLLLCQLSFMAVSFGLIVQGNRPKI
jgi:hypothetical protein